MADWEECRARFVTARVKTALARPGPCWSGLDRVQQVVTCGYFAGGACRTVSA
jgi:hypothetical protein